MGEAFSLSRIFGSNLFKTETTLPLSASPQTLSLGKFALSINILGIPAFARNNAVTAPPGPAPIMQTFVLSKLFNSAANIKV